MEKSVLIKIWPAGWRVDRKCRCGRRAVGWLRNLYRIRILYGIIGVESNSLLAGGINKSFNSSRRMACWPVIRCGIRVSYIIFFQYLVNLLDCWRSCMIGTKKYVVEGLGNLHRVSVLYCILGVEGTLFLRI